MRIFMIVTFMFSFPWLHSLSPPHHFWSTLCFAACRGVSFYSTDASALHQLYSKAANKRGSQSKSGYGRRDEFGKPLVSFAPCRLQSLFVRIGRLFPFCSPVAASFLHILTE
jgi:hypothetical protein